MKTLVATAALIGTLALASTSASARDIGREFREGWNPGGKNLESQVDGFSTGFTPVVSRSVEDILRDKARDGFAKPESFPTGVDLDGI